MLLMVMTVKRGRGYCFDEVVFAVILFMRRTREQQSGRDTAFLHLLLWLLLLNLPRSSTM